MIKIPLSPKQLLILDGLGALLSAFLLGIVLVHYQNVFGIPLETLYFLAILPCFFALFDAYHVVRNRNLGKPLYAIALLNLLYGILSFSLAVVHRDVLTAWGWGYILLEIAIIACLAFMEWRAAKSI